MSEGFQGNKNVKAGGTKTSYTREQILEYAKCADDPCYFIENYVKVISLDAGVVPFKLRPYQRRIVETVHNNRFTIGMLFRQSGKALPLDTPIPTPNGFVPMKDIHVGDVVFGNDGLPTTVTAESEVKPLTMYRITFDTGESVVACKDHLWEVYDRYNSREKVAPNKYTHKRLVVTTEELSQLKWKVVDKRGKNLYSYYIPNTKPVQYEKKDVRIDPYLLGVWLGDGNSSDNRFTFERKNYEFFKANGVTAVNLGEGARKKNTDVYTSIIAELSLADLRHYGLVNHKHIPNDYLFSSVEQRLALLQGIMDTDGAIGKTGVCELSFSEKYPDLLATVETLLYSLGLKVKKQYRASTRSYRFMFYCSIDTFPVFRIPYKLERQRPRTKYHRYTSSRSIVNIERLEGEQLGKCIQVANQQRMYLCGKNYLPTHNSTIMAAYCLWYITFNDHKTAAILANKKAQAVEIFSRMQYMYELLPDFLKPGVIEWNKTSCTLDSGSKCFCAASSSSSIRGRSINLLLLDEFAYLQSGIAEDFIASVFPTLTSSKESKLVIISTPAGLNQFYRIWKDSENGKNDFVRVRGYWNEIYDQKWYDEQCRLLNNDKAKISSELDCLFLGSAQTLIDSSKIQCLVAENPIFERNNLRVFEAPKKDHAYYVTVDVSRGRGLDYSAVIVFDVTAFPFNVVATFKDNTISPMELPTLIYNLGMQYNEALVLIEANDLGESVANELWWTLEYPGVLHTKDGKIGGSGILGVKTTKGVKNRGCSKVKELIENDQLIVNDGRIIEELEGYVLGKKGSYEAQNTKINDDLCACLFLFGWSCESDYFRDYANNDVSRTLIDRYKADVEETIPAIGSFTDGGDDPYESLRLNSDQIEMLR